MSFLFFSPADKTEKKIKILDASAIIHGYNPLFYNDDYYITPEVLEEIETNKIIIDQAINIGKVKIKSPKKEFIDKVIKTVKDLGEELSEADIKTIALALELDGEVISDDFGIHNVSKKLNVKVRGIYYNTDKKIIWRKVCIGCKKKYPIDYEGECEVCGSEVKRKAINVKK